LVIGLNVTSSGPDATTEYDPTAFGPCVETTNVYGTPASRKAVNLN
jgi:hypothetical protein